MGYQSTIIICHIFTCRERVDPHKVRHAEAETEAQRFLQEDKRRKLCNEAKKWIQSILGEAHTENSKEMAELRRRIYVADQVVLFFGWNSD